MTPTHKEPPMTEETTPGTTTVSPDVLIAIARLEALKVEGVHQLAPVPGGVNRFFRKGGSEGVRIEISDGVVDVDLYVVLESNVNLRQVSREIQKAIARAITEMVGMTVGRIDIHIEDIHYPQG